MAGAAGVLARGWFRGQRRWWTASALVLAFVVALVLVVQGTFTGMERATEDRVADFFTGSVRITSARQGAAVPELFPANQTAAIARQLEAAGGAGTHASPRYESQYILSRRSLIEAYLEENNRYEVNVGGNDAASNNAYGAGVLVGLPADDRVVTAPIQHYLVAGRMPHPRNGTIEIALSLGSFNHYVSASERANLSAWPPTDAEMQAFAFEITSARVDASGQYKDLIREPARVVGLWDSGLDALDAVTAVTDLAAAQRLSAQPQGAGGAANAFTVSTQHPGAVEAWAAGRGWKSDEPGPFAQHYIGQLLVLIHSLGVLFAGVFFALPLFLVWYGLQQMLDRQRRELGVLRALGLPGGVLRSALLRLVAGVLAGAALLSALAVGLVWLAAPWVEGHVNLPFPVRFVVPPLAVAAVAVAAAVSTVLAFLLAWRRARLQDLASLLRAS